MILVLICDVKQMHPILVCVYNGVLTLSGLALQIGRQCDAVCSYHAGNGHDQEPDAGTPEYCTNLLRKPYLRTSITPLAVTFSSELPASTMGVLSSAMAGALIITALLYMGGW